VPSRLGFGGTAGEAWPVASAASQFACVTVVCSICWMRWSSARLTLPAAPCSPCPNEPMRKRTIDLMQDCLAVLEGAEIEDPTIGQLKAEIALYQAKAAVREAFENAETPASKPKSKPRKKAHKPAKASKSIALPSRPSLVA
jgi:hypothetical protein